MTVLPKPNPRVAELAKETLAPFRYPDDGYNGDRCIVLSEQRADSLEQRIAEAIWKYRQEQK